MTGPGNNTYLLIGTNATATLIDAGVGDARHLAELAEHLSRSAAELRTVLVTHAHGDHASGAPAIAMAHPTATFHKFSWPDEDSRFQVRWHPLADGDECDLGGATLIALHTPGHSPDHMVFWDASTRTIFSGDLVVQGSSVMIHASRGGDLGDYLASLQRLLDLGPARLLPAHGPEIADPEAVLREYIDHRMMRERQVVAALKAGCDTVPRIAEYIYDGLDPALMTAAHENVRAHLEKLRREKRAFEANARWRL